MSSLYDYAFVTGCDVNTEWQLPWFITNYIKYNDLPLIIANFGMSDDMLQHLESIDYIKVINVVSNAEGWFKKPAAIYDATYASKVVCWLDTDCEVKGNISSIFDHYRQGILGMVEDRPWTRRRGTHGKWYNSGVVLTDRNHNLRDWKIQCERDPSEGDQEVLYAMLSSKSEIEKLRWIEPLPHKYNTLRLDYIDQIAVKDPLIIHHTGKQGKDTIHEAMSCNTY